MPKNVVQRLQKIENDLKTVVSLYEVSNKSKNNDKPETSKEQDTEQFPKIRAPKRMEAFPVFDKFREVPGKSEAPLLDPFKKTNSFVPRSPQGICTGEPVLGKKCKPKRPGSAPSSCSTLSTICETDCIWQQSSETDGSLEHAVLSKAKTSENLNSDWVDSTGVFPSYAVVMTPSKTLETAHKILARSNFDDKEQNEPLLHELVPMNRKTKEAEHCVTGEETTRYRLDAKSSQSKNSDVKKLIQAYISPTDVNGSNHSHPVKKEASLEQIIEWSFPIKSGSFVTTEIYNSGESNESPTVFVTSKERMDQKNSNSEVTKNFTLRLNKVTCSKTKLSTESIRLENDNKKKSEVIQKLSEKFNFQKTKNHEKIIDDKTDEKKTRSIFEKDKKLQVVGSIRSNQKKNNVDDTDDAELWINELSKIIVKSNEKLEKMKVSKELALDIAKHLKNKYDEIRKSKEELTEKVKMLEKNNERLNTEIKETRELNCQLLHKTEGPKTSKTRLTEDSKNTDKTKEILWLKSKLSGPQKKQNSDVIEKATKIEEIQKERFMEPKNEGKSREILLSKIQTLTTEKSDLLIKLNELQCQMYESQSKENSLQENIRQLKEEVQKQKQYLMIKTEALQDTNKQLSVIRQNSTELEEQVKVLRKNLDDFGEAQKNLLKQTSEYERHLREDEEKIKKMKDENERLKVELENEKDGLLIKAKIIEDQQHTIKQLKEKAEDAKTLLKRNQSLERVLNNEKEEKFELQEAVQRLKWRKQELKKKVKTLENDFLLAPQEVVKDLQKTQFVLHELENQVQVKQKEWELQLQSLVKEKEQACRVAEFATKKLRETTTEFQKQTNAYKNLQRILAENLAVKQKFREGRIT